MEENPIPETTPAAEENGCIKCQSPDVLHGYPNKLCAPCRQSLIKYPIPLWVKLFGAGTLAVMLIALIWLPKNLNAAIHLARAEKAEEALEYLTEQKELTEVLKTVPNSDDALLHMIIASYHTGDLTALYTAAGALGGKKMQDTALVNRANALMEEATLFLPDSAYRIAITDKYKNTAVPDSAFAGYIAKHPTDLFPLLGYAGSCVDQQKYTLADSLLGKALDLHPGYAPAVSMRAMVKRELNMPEESIKYCDQLLSLNHQDLYAMSSKARTLIRSKKNKEGLALAEQVYALDKEDGYNTSTLVLAYHFNKDLKKRDQFAALAVKDSVHAVYYQYVKDVITNKVNYQN